MLIVWDKISHIFCWFRRIFAKFSKCGIFSNRCHLFNIFENNIPQNPNHVLLEKQMQNWKNFVKIHEKWHILWCWNFKELSSAEIWCDRQKKVLIPPGYFDFCRFDKSKGKKLQIILTCVLNALVLQHLRFSWPARKYCSR